MKKKRERERVSSFLSRCYSPPFDVLLSLLKSSQVRCVCFSPRLRHFFLSTCNDSRKHRTTRKRHKRRAKKKQLIKKNTFFWGKRGNQKNPKKGGALHQLIFERLFSPTLSLSYILSFTHTHLHNTHILL